MGKRVILGLLVLIISTSLELKADFISLIRADQCETITEVYIEEDQIRVTFEIGEQDYLHFLQLIPEEYIENGQNNQNKTEKPERVAITPPIIEGYGGMLANIGFVSYHRGLPVNDLRYLTKNKLTADGIAIPSILNNVHFVEVKLSGIQILENVWT